MPSSQTRVHDLRKKIQELEVREGSHGLTPEAELQLAFTRKWLELAGKDWIIVIRPRGVIGAGKERAPARMVEVHDQVAADRIVFGPRRNEPARLATPEECQLWRDFEEANKAAHRKVIAGAQAKVAIEGVNALMGQLSAAGHAAGAPAQANHPAPPEVHLDEPGEDPENLTPELSTTPAPGTQGASAVPPAGDAPTDDGLDPDMGKLGRADHVRLLLENGYTSVDQVAEAGAQKLTEISGIGPATAAKLMVEASEIQAERDAAAEGGGEASDSAEG
jgi:hypothetical protein